MIPQTQDKYLGIEIEFVSDLSFEEIEDILFEMNLNLFCDLKTDGSVIYTDKWGNKGKHPTEDYEQDIIWEGYELCVLTKQRNLFSTLEKLKPFFRKIDAWVNDSCGLHVHLDMRNRNVHTSYVRLVDSLDEMKRILPASRINANAYNKFLDKETYMKQYYDGMKRDFHKQYIRSAITIESYIKYKTLEVRSHEGTLNMGEIYNWCQYLLSIINNKRTDRVNRYVKRRSAINY